MKYLIIGLCSLVSFSNSYACSTCGCASSNEYLGMLSDLPAHFIGIQYQYRWYESHHDYTEPNKPVGREYYQSLQLWGRYTVGKRVQLFGFLPYQYNVKREGGQTNTLSGIGDATLLANIKMLQTKNSAARWRHHLLAGGGVKAPTGAYDKMVLGGGDDLAPSMQAGTGAWAFVSNANYTLQHDRIAVNAEASYVITLTNYQDYKYGNRFNAGVQLSYQAAWGKSRLLPMAGIRYELVSPAYDNYSTASIAPYTGGYMMFASGGFQGYYRHVGLKMAYYLPIAQNYGEGLVRSLGSMEAGVAYLF